MAAGGRSALFGLTAGVAAVALATFALVGPASAQGIFETIFGGLQRIFERPAPPPDPLNSMARAPNPSPAQRWSDGGPSRGFCVRTCDGYYFPVQTYPGASAAEMCHAFCPASETRVYGGSNIDYGVTRDGSRYADLDKAYLYRKQLVAGCTCNGRNHFGLAHIDINSDPTLRRGEVVATRNGLLAFSGRNAGADFTPVASFSGFAPSYRAQLSAIRIMPPTSGETTGTTSSLRPPMTAEFYDLRRGQFAR